MERNNNHKKLMRIGTDSYANMTTLNKLYAFDLLFDGMSELVYVPPYYPWQVENESTTSLRWTGALSSVLNGT